MTVLQYVLEQLENAARKYQSKHGCMPVLVINGIDLWQKKTIISLVDRAKYLANTCVLKIILVSSEGSVMTLIKATSSKPKLTDTVKVLDISDEEALKYFDKLVPNELTQRIVSVCGGRFVRLMMAQQQWRI